MVIRLRRLTYLLNYYSLRSMINLYRKYKYKYNDIFLQLKRIKKNKYKDKKCITSYSPTPN